MYLILFLVKSIQEAQKNPLIQDAVCVNKYMKVSQ